MTAGPSREAPLDDGKDVATIVSSREYALFRKWQVDGLLTAMNELAAEAAGNGLTEEKLAELLLISQ